MSTLLNCWEGVRKGGGGGGGGGGDLHYSLDIMSFFKDLTQKLVNSFFFANHEQGQVHYKHIFKPFLANRERRHVHYKDIVKPFFCNSRTKTCSVQTLCQIILFCKSRT